jgi:hypothetical protein
MIALSYLNTTAATIAALRDHDNMVFTVANAPEKIQRISSELMNPGTPTLSDMPSPPKKTYKPDTLANRVGELDVLRERYNAAKEYMEWFEPAWQFLSSEERTVLCEYYMAGSRNSGAAKRLMDIQGISSATAERLRSRAVAHLRTLLYGRR